MKYRMKIINKKCGDLVWKLNGWEEVELEPIEENHDKPNTDHQRR